VVEAEGTSGCGNRLIAKTKNFYRFLEPNEGKDNERITSTWHLSLLYWKPNTEKPLLQCGHAEEGDGVVFPQSNYKQNLGSAAVAPDDGYGDEDYGAGVVEEES